MLAGSKLVADMFQLEPTSNLLRTSFEPASVMEFGFYRHDANIGLQLQHQSDIISGKLQQRTTIA